MCASLAIGDSRSTNPALYTGLGTRPIVMEWFEFLDLKPHGSPFNSTSAYPKNRPASYFLEARRCPPALPSRGTSNPEISLEITSRGEYAALFDPCFPPLNPTTPQKRRSLVELCLPPFLVADGPSDQVAWVEFSSTALREECAPSTRAATFFARPPYTTFLKEQLRSFNLEGYSGR